MERLENLLNSLWANVVEQQSIDIFNHKIMFRTKLIENGSIMRYKVMFEGVSSFYFLENTGDDRFNSHEPEEDDYLELTSIDYHPNGIGLISVQSKTEEWVQKYIANANFSLELWNAMLFIEAKKITINDLIFEVGYPNEK